MILEFFLRPITLLGMAAFLCLDFIVALFLYVCSYPHRPIHDLRTVQFQSQSRGSFGLEIDVTEPLGLACFRITYQMN